MVAMVFACALVAPAFAADKAPDHAAQMTLDKQLFAAGAVPACAICHTLKDAGAEGAIGPVLDELQPDAARVAKALRAGLGGDAFVCGQADGCGNKSGGHLCFAR